MSSDHRPQSFDCLALLDLEQFLGRTVPILSDAEHSLVVSSCTNLQRHSPEVLHLLSIELGPILYRNPQCHPRVSKYWTDLIGPELHHKLWFLERSHGSKKQFAGVGDDFPQCKSGKRFPLIDCEVIRSCIEVAISTSWTHDIVSMRQGVFAHTSALKLTFPALKVD